MQKFLSMELKLLFLFGLVVREVLLISIESMQIPEKEVY